MNGTLGVPDPINELVRSYAPGSKEKQSLKAKLREMLSREIEIPLIIGGEEVRTGSTTKVICPHDHGHVLASCHMARVKEVEMATALFLPVHGRSLVGEKGPFRLSRLDIQIAMANGKSGMSRMVLR